MLARSVFVLLGTVLYKLIVVKDTIKFWKLIYQIRILNTWWPFNAT
jgi:hypothetical protein